jgi:hypothetical protein
MLQHPLMRPETSQALPYLPEIPFSFVWAKPVILIISTIARDLNSAEPK